RRSSGDLGPGRLERNISRLAAVRASRHRRGEGTVDEGLDRGWRPKAGGKGEQFRPGTKKALLDLFVDSDVSAPEPVNRLLRVANQEELTGNRLGRAPVRLTRIVGGEQEKDLGLERIGVLELVDEEVGEALLQLVADSGIIADEIARLDEE